MNHTFKRMSWVVLLAAMIPATSTAATPVLYPEQIPVSGILSDAEGELLTGEHEVELGVFYDERGGDALYSESFDITGSRLDVALGSKPDPAIPRLTDLVLDADALFIEVVIDGEVQRPRIQLGAIPYALHAMKADSALKADFATRATNADLATTAKTAEVANTCVDASTLGGKSAADFLPSTYTPPAPTYAQIGDKPSFSTNAPLSLNVQGSAHVFSIAPCAQASQVLAWSGGSWGCQGLPAQLIASGALKITGNTITLQNDSVEDYHLAGGAVTTDKIAQNAITNDHIAFGAIGANKVQGFAVVRDTMGSQTIAGTLTVAPNQVQVSGAFSATQIRAVNPIPRVYRVWADQFRPVFSASAGNMVLNENNQFYMNTAPNTPYRATMVASLPALPEDAVLDHVQCYYTQEAGSLQGTSIKAVRTLINGAPNVRSEDITTLGSLAPSSAVRVSAIGPSLNRDLANTRLHLELDWRPSLLSTWSKFLGCEVTVLTANPF